MGYVFEDDAADCLNSSLSHNRSTELEVGRIESDARVVRELNGARTAETTCQAVLSHLADELVVTEYTVRSVRSF